MAYLQDLLVYTLGGLAFCLQAAKGTGIDLKEINGFICESLFSTKTNVNFNKGRIKEYLERAVVYRDGLKGRLSERGKAVPLHDSVDFVPAKEEEGLLEQAKKVSSETRKEVLAPKSSTSVRPCLWPLRA